MKYRIKSDGPGAFLIDLRIVLVFAIVVNALSAQVQVDQLIKYQELRLPESAGSVPVMYSPSVEQRALRYRESLAAAVNWYSKQLKVSVPITLAVADRDTWEKVQPADPRSVPYFMPYSIWRNSPADDIHALVVLPARMEDFPGFEVMGVKPDLLAEAISFHEAGHIFAHVLGIWSGNPFVNELIANFLRLVTYERDTRSMPS
jgi:hypothetical protein